LFPAKVALALGMAKCFLALLLLAFGALALWEQAAMSYLGSGLWCGAVVALSGLMGIMAAQRSNNLVYIVSFLLMSVLSLAAIGLLLIFAATGLARDSDAPYGYFVDQEDGSAVEILGTVALRQRAVIINAVLVALGVVETMASLASIVICLREVCQCYTSRQLGDKASSLPNLLTADRSPEGQARAYRLLRWLGAQNRTLHPPHPPHPPRQLYHSRSAMPRFYTTGAPTIPVLTPVAFPSFVTGAPTAYVIPSLMSHRLPPYAGYAPFYSLNLPSAKANDIHADCQHVDNKHREKRRRRRSRKSDDVTAATTTATTATTAATAAADVKQSLNSSLMEQAKEEDSVSFIHTGLDREIAEELIFHSMHMLSTDNVIDNLDSKSEV